jgi:hypothetical protein
MRLIWPTELREKRATCEILAYTGYSPRREQQNSLMRMSVLLWCSMFQTKEIFLLKQFFFERILRKLTIGKEKFHFSYHELDPQYTYNSNHNLFS